MTPVLVVGAGTMGSGIAQVAAQAGCPVRLFDSRQGAAGQAVDRLAATLEGLAAKGKIAADAAGAAIARIAPIASLEEGGGAAVAIEAIVEDPGAKRALLQRLESVVAADGILASNTSSISITALANGLARPERLVGMHFFNPVPLMRLVEVVSGLQTAPAAAEAVCQLARVWGKVPVPARSTPGFIVNRIARPFYAETLMLLQERAAPPAVIDYCLRGAGFRMGPCELMDLIGHDVNLAVTRSVFEANFFDRRYAPSRLQQEMVEGGLLGRKSGRGFYPYPEGLPALPAAGPAGPELAREVVVHGRGAMAERLAGDLATALGRRPERDGAEGWTGLRVAGGCLVLTDGRTAGEMSGVLGTGQVAVFDWPVQAAPGGVALACAFAATASEDWRMAALAWLRRLGFHPLPIADAPGLIVARTVAMLINEAADAVAEGVCTSDGADAAMKLGTAYPRGPFEWLAEWGASAVGGVLEGLDAAYRGERYRVSPSLRRQQSHRQPRIRHAGIY